VSFRNRFVACRACFPLIASSSADMKAAFFLLSSFF